MPILWGVPAPARHLKSSIGLVCIRSGETALGVKLGPLVGLETHWIGRTVVCLGSEECPNHGAPVTWKGFVPMLMDGLSWRGKLPGSHLGVLVVSEEIGKEVENAPVNNCFRVSRIGHRSNAAMSFEQLGRAKTRELPDCFDVKPYVMRGMRLPQFVVAKLREAV